MSKYNAKKITLGFLGTIGVIVFLFESWTLANGDDGDTISATLTGVGDNQTFVPLADGLLAGHLWKTPKALWSHIVGQVVGYYCWPLLDGKQISDGAKQTLKELKRDTNNE